VSIQAIVVADDFGLSPGVNRGVVQAHERGPVTTASLLGNMPGFADAVAHLRACPDLAVGLHLNLTLGRPVSDPRDVPSLVAADGDFLRFGPWLRRWATGRIVEEQVRRECTAQAERLAGAGLRLGHCDVHQHLDALPVVCRAVVDTCRQHGITAVRPLRERPTPRDLWALNLPGPRVVAWPKRLAKFGLMCVLAARSNRAYTRAGLFMPGQCVGLFIGGGQDLAGYQRIFAGLPRGVSEVCVHPAYVDEGLRATPFKFVEARETELRALTSPELMESLRSNRVQLTTYQAARERQPQ